MKLSEQDKIILKEVMQFRFEAYESIDNSECTRELQNLAIKMKLAKRISNITGLYFEWII